MTEPTHTFDALVRLPEDQVRLAAAALWYATDEYPHLKVAHYLGQLDQFAARVDRANARTPEDRIEALRAVLVDELGFCGDRNDYENPENSYLNRVIVRRRGIPVTLSAVWLDVAGRLGWRLHGVNMPGHFLISMTTSEGEVYIDPFHDGRELRETDCRQMATEMFGPEFAWHERHLERIGGREMLLRMLSNLHSLYLLRQDWRRTARVLERMLALRPTDPHLAVELAQLLMTLGESGKALGLLNLMAQQSLPDAQREFLDRQLHILHTRMAQNN